MKKVLLTGGSGFIGRNIKESFLKDYYEIIAPSHAELPLEETKKVDAFFAKNTFDIVLHTATKPGHRNAKDFSDLTQTNLRMFYNLERNARLYGKLINFGSGAVYSVAENISNVKEENLYKSFGNDSHSFCKYIISKHIENMPTAVDLNIFGIFGKYEDYAIRFISNAICKALFDLPITLKQNRRFSYLFIDDLMPILQHFMEHDAPYKSYNIVPDEVSELKSIANLVKEISQKNIDISIASESYGLDYYGNNTKLREFMPKVTFTSLKTAVHSLYTWYKRQASNINLELLMVDK